MNTDKTEETSNIPAANNTELLAPAGCPESGYAALQYGADAVYLGLAQFSARAQAQNFTEDDLLDFTGHAHSLERPRQVYVTMNTLAQQKQLPEIIENMHLLQRAGVDALIVQDLGICRIIREHFPNLRIHASTQMAVHNTAGARALQQLGIERVTLARELTLEEIAEICAIGNLEVEAFIHGALCYSYSGLCLFSSMVTGRSANRGRCAYPCRGDFSVCANSDSSISGEAENATGHIFSMKDLTLGEGLGALLRTGVNSLKIEGRMKSPLYVATVVDMYRKLLDGALDEDGLKQAIARVQSVYSRASTKFFMGGKSTGMTDRGGIIDPLVVGHRGACCGKVKEIVKRPEEDVLCFTTSVELQRFDGLQIDIPGESQPYGFSVENLKLAQNSKRVFVAPAGSEVEIPLPPEHPQIPTGASVYRASSQEVKQAYKTTLPRPGENKARQKINVSASLHTDKISLKIIVNPEDGSKADALDFNKDFPLEKELTPARSLDTLHDAARSSFEKTGDTPFTLDGFELINPQGLFVPVSLLNKIRRDALEEFGTLWDEYRQQNVQRIISAVCPETSTETVPAQNQDVNAKAGNEELLWSIKTDNAAVLPDIFAGKFGNVAELIIQLEASTATTIAAELEKYRNNGNTKLRIAMPAICRSTDEAVTAAAKELLKNGWTDWEASNLWGWQFLNSAAQSAGTGRLSLAADWPLYALNQQAVEQLLDMGFERFTLSPEDERDNILQLIHSFPQKHQLVIYQDTPLMIGEACGIAALNSYTKHTSCNPVNCAEKPLQIISGHAQKFYLIRRNCRSYLVGDTPYSLVGKLKDLRENGVKHVRADFMYKPYTPEDMLQIWELLQKGETPDISQQGNYLRGLS